MKYFAKDSWFLDVDFLDFGDCVGLEDYVDAIRAALGAGEVHYDHENDDYGRLVIWDDGSGDNERLKELFAALFQQGAIAEIPDDISGEQAMHMYRIFGI